MMNRRFPTSSLAWHGMTLVEVVAGLALLGTLLVSLLLTKSALAKQRAVAEQKLAAVAACDRVLAEHRVAGRLLPRSGGGMSHGYRWRSEVIRRQQVQDVTLDVMRVWVTSERDDKPLAEVEIVQAPLGEMK
jgi:type II secretory pathway pseudopilin PulG